MNSSIAFDARLWPQDMHESDRLLDVFLIEKALYEIEYELSHRPQWVRVPLAGILRILAARQEAQEAQEMKEAHEVPA